MDCEVARLTGAIHPGSFFGPWERVMSFGKAWLTLVIAASAVHAGEPKKIDFAHDIVPILKARCAECHTNGKYKGGLSLDTREALLKAKGVVPHKSGDSKLLKRITSTDPEERMPPK